MQPTRGQTPRHPARVRAARSAMFSPSAHTLLERLQGVLCEPARAKIIRALMAGELTVGDLAIVIERSPSSTSQHLRVLRELNIVTSLRRGRAVYNALAGDLVVATARKILDVVEDGTASPKAPTAG